MNRIAIFLVGFILTWRVLLQKDCQPVIDPWTGGLIRAENCKETYHDHRSAWFDTREELDAFLKTKPDNVDTVRVIESESAKKRKRARK